MRRALLPVQQQHAANLTAAITAQDLEAARAAYLAMRPFYEQIEACAVPRCSVPLDASVDLAELRCWATGSYRQKCGRALHCALALLSCGVCMSGCMDDRCTHGLLQGPEMVQGPEGQGNRADTKF